MNLEEAKQYVGTTELSGQLQFELLKKEGLQPSSKVLDIGSGVLHAGFVLIRYLQKEGYVGIEPNQWLTEQALEQPGAREEAAKKQAQFLNVADFDASSTNVIFDFILSHSILSHAAHHQLKQFLQNASKVLAPRGKILASIRLAEGNPWGSDGSPDKRNSLDKEWQYPDNSFFTQLTVEETADSCGLAAKLKPEFTEFYVASRPSEFHDWFVFTKK